MSVLLGWALCHHKCFPSGCWAGLCPQMMPSTHKWRAQPWVALGHPSILMLSLGVVWTVEEPCSPFNGELCGDSPSTLPLHHTGAGCLCPSLPGCTVCSSGGPRRFPNIPWHPSGTGFVLKRRVENVHQIQIVVCNKHYFSSPSPEATECRHSPPASFKPEIGRDCLVWFSLKYSWLCQQQDLSPMLCSPGSHTCIWTNPTDHMLPPTGHTPAPSSTPHSRAFSGHTAAALLSSTSTSALCQIKVLTLASCTIHVFTSPQDQHLQGYGAGNWQSCSSYTSLGIPPSWAGPGTTQDRHCSVLWEGRWV